LISLIVFDKILGLAISLGFLFLLFAIKMILLQRFLKWLCSFLYCCFQFIFQLHLSDLSSLYIFDFLIQSGYLLDFFLIKPLIILTFLASDKILDVVILYLAQILNIGPINTVSLLIFAKSSNFSVKVLVSFHFLKKINLHSINK
jgi:hypothetical protein